MQPIRPIRPIRLGYHVQKRIPCRLVKSRYIVFDDDNGCYSTTSIMWNLSETHLVFNCFTKRGAVQVSHDKKQEWGHLQWWFRVIRCTLFVGCSKHYCELWLNYYWLRNLGIRFNSRNIYSSSTIDVLTIIIASWTVMVVLLLVKNRNLAGPYLLSQVATKIISPPTYFPCRSSVLWVGVFTSSTFVPAFFSVSLFCFDK